MPDQTSEQPSRGTPETQSEHGNPKTKDTHTPRQRAAGLIKRLGEIRTIRKLFGRPSDILEQDRLPTQSTNNSEATPSYEEDLTHPQLVHVEAREGNVVYRAGTNIERRRLERAAQAQLAEVTLHDFTQQPELLRDLRTAETISKDYLRERMEKFGGRTANLNDLHPYYLQDTEENRVAGDVNPNTGLLVVYPNPENVIDSALTVAHEMSHGANGIVRQIGGFPDAEPFTIVGGLERSNMFHGTTGAMLNNNMAVLDAAYIYQRLKVAGLEPKRTSLQEWSLSHITPETAKTDTSYSGQIDQRVLAARSLGIPNALLEPYAFNTAQLDNLVIIWKIARILGTKGQHVGRIDNATLFEEGRDILDRTRYQVTREAHERIEQIFGEKAKVILDATHHPESTAEIFTTLKEVETKLGLPTGPVLPTFTAY